MNSTLTPSQYATTAEHLMAAKMFSLASCVMLFYDMFLTFGDEVEKIWMQRFTGATVLWFLNRYLSPLGYIVVTVAFHDPRWGPAACNRYVLFPEVLKIFTATAVGLIFILRLYAIYSRSRIILISFSILLAAELGVKIYAFTDGTRLILPPGLVGCILVGRSAPVARIVYTWVAELVFDSCVFFATLYKTIYLYRNMPDSSSSVLLRIFLRDGIMYFAVIFASNLVTTLIFVTVTPDLKVVNASFSTLVTTLMVSRLMLNLRQGKDQMTERRSGQRSSTILHDVSMESSPKDDFTATVIGNLGQPVTLWTEEWDAENTEHGVHSRRHRHITQLENPPHAEDAIEMQTRVSLAQFPAEDRDSRLGHGAHRSPTSGWRSNSEVNY